MFEYWQIVRRHPDNKCGGGTCDGLASLCAKETRVECQDVLYIIVLYIRQYILSSGILSQREQLLIRKAAF